MSRGRGGALYAARGSRVGGARQEGSGGGFGECGALGDVSMCFVDRIILRK